MEALEGRVLLSSGSEITVPSYREVSGVVFADTNKSGAPEPDEPVFAGASIYYDSNSNERFDAGEVTVVTDENGHYRLMIDVGGGRPELIKPLAPPVGWVWHHTNVIEPDTRNFAVVPIPSGIIKGRVFDDANGNGLMDDGEVGVAGANIAVNGASTGFVLTDQNGGFDFDGLPARQLALRVTSGPDVQLDLKIVPVTLDEGESKTLDVPVSLFGSVWGLVLEQRKGHSPVQMVGVNVYFDQNNNGQRDAGEVTAQSGSSGEYFFTHVPAGNFTVRLEQIPADTRLVSSLPTGTAVRGKDVEVGTIFIERPRVKPSRKATKEVKRCNDSSGEIRLQHTLLCAPPQPKTQRKMDSPKLPRSLADKVDQSVWNAIQVHFHPGRFPLIAYVTNPQFSRFDSHDNVQVDIYTFGRSTPHEAELRAMNINVGAVVDMHNYRGIEGWVSVRQIRELVKFAWVRQIGLPEYAIFDNPNPNPVPIIWGGGVKGGTGAVQLRKSLTKIASQPRIVAAAQLL